MRGPDGVPLRVFATLAHTPVVMEAAQALSRSFFDAGSSLSPRERELVIVRVAAVVGSAYEVAQHRGLSLSVGIRDQEIRALMGSRAAGDFSPDVDALLDLVDALLLEDDAEDQMWDAACSARSASWGGGAGHARGYFRAVSMVTRVLRVPLDPWLASSSQPS